MPKIPTYWFEAGVILDADTGREAHIEFHTPAWDALLEWLRFHGVDPMRVPAETTIIRDGSLRQIRYQRAVESDDGALKVINDEEGWRVAMVPTIEQNEAIGPLPPEVLALMRPAASGDGLVLG